jgi:hypothetical protein
LSLFLEPYKAYEVRLLPRGTGISSFDTAPKSVTLYPGNVAEVEWNVTPLFILFGRAIDGKGQPIAEANISGSHGIGRTDAGGYFQIETNQDDRLRLTEASGAGCNIALGTAKPDNGLVSAGDVECR